jgi:RNA polymerase sigma-70 factor (ECF subfamily)
LRSKNREPLTSDDSSVDQLIQATPDPSPETELFDLEHERQIFAWAAEKIRNSFQPKSWQAFWLTAVENQPAEQVARELGISRGAVYIARSRVMARLREKVQNHSGLFKAESGAVGTVRPDVERNER